MHVTAKRIEQRLLSVGCPEGRGLAADAALIELVNVADGFVAVVDGPGDGAALEGWVFVQRHFPTGWRPADGAIGALADSHSIVVELEPATAYRTGDLPAAGELQHPDTYLADARCIHLVVEDEQVTAVVDAVTDRERAEGDVAGFGLDCLADSAGARPHRCDKGEVAAVLPSDRGPGLIDVASVGLSRIRRQRRQHRGPERAM